MFLNNEKLFIFRIINRPTYFRLKWEFRKFNYDNLILKVLPIDGTYLLNII